MASQEAAERGSARQPGQPALPKMERYQDLSKAIARTMSVKRAAVVLALLGALAVFATLGMNFRSERTATAAGGTTPLYISKSASIQITNFESFVYSPSNTRDPRITPLGALLRSSSLDELPQLVNVLRGEMSLVGPRPELEELASQYPQRYQRRLDVPPGITGLAQISGRSDLSYGRTMTYDLSYVDRRSLALNIAILARTLAAVIDRRGARWRHRGHRGQQRWQPGIRAIL